MNARKSILLADDHEVVRAGLVEALCHFEPEFDVLEADCLDAALEVLAGPKGRDVAIGILDLIMPGMNGVRGIGRVVERYPSVPIAVLTGSIRPRDVEAAFTAGASGYIPKTMRITAMAKAIRGIMAGERYIPFDLARSIDTDAASSEFNLTPRELQTLRAIAEGLSNKEIARHLSIEEVTVKLHAGNIYRKLNTSNRTQAALRARELGIV